MRTEDVEKIEKAMERYGFPVEIILILINGFGDEMEKETERIKNGMGDKEPTGIVPEAPHDNA